jgi:hypothetical protein
MIDPITLPILLKAVDWLFGEGSKILQERRERRRSAQAAGEAETSEAPTPTTSLDNVNTIRSKEDALSQSVSPIFWKDSEPRVEHLLSLIDIYTKNYYLAKEQYARWGDALVPSIIVHNLTESEDNILIVTKELQSILSQTYTKRLNIPGVQ